MIDWREVEVRLAALARDAQPWELLGVTLPLPRWAAAGLRVDEPWFAWRRPEEGRQFLGIGAAFAVASAGEERFHALGTAQRAFAGAWRCEAAGLPPPVAFAGFAFGPAGGGPLPNAELRVPELLLRADPAGDWVTFACRAERAGSAPARWRALWGGLHPASRTRPVAPASAVLRNAFAEADFVTRGRAALRAIDEGLAEKLVLTRTFHLRSDRPLAPGRLLDSLAAQHPACATFGVGRGGWAFVGASPETLLATAGPDVAADALAGTAWQAAGQGLEADKNRREHEIVARAVAAGLGALCHDVRVPAAEVLRLDAIAHWRRRVLARRPAGVSAFDLIARLHPTPAVGGAPASVARDWLARHGEHRDAWYTGGIGWVDGAGDADIAVALRCGLLDGNAVTLYAGAGFVAGSDPLQELAETEAKLGAMRGAIAAACAGEDKRAVAA